MKIWLTFLVTFSLSLFATPTKTTYVYNKLVQGKDSQTTWTVEKNDDIWRIQGEGAGGHTVVTASPTEINTQSFSYESKRTSNYYSIKRHGNQLKAVQKMGDRNVERMFSLSSENWVQEFDFSFKPFILSNAREFKFCIINPKKLDLHKMIAYKQGIDQTDINGKIQEALKVKVTLRGFKSMFWHAELWFEEKSGDLLKYKANEGPNTPTSIITLISKEET